MKNEEMPPRRVTKDYQADCARVSSQGLAGDAHKKQKQAASTHCPSASRPTHGDTTEGVKKMDDALCGARWILFFFSF